MIYDAYVTTRSLDSIEVRIAADKEEEIDLSIEGGENCGLQAAAPQSSYKNMRFFRRRFTGLRENHPYRITVQGTDAVKLDTETLGAPGGEQLCRFAMLPDPHIAGPATEKKLPVDRGSRLYSKAPELLKRYCKKAAELGAEFIVLTGDIADPANKENMKIVSRIKESTPLPWYPLLGNHELNAPGALKRFTSCMNIPAEGYYASDICGQRLIFLSCPDQSSLMQDTPQYSWLIDELEANREKNCFIFCHYSVVLHPCVRGRKDDGKQTLFNSRALTLLLKNYPNVRAWFAGHKNIPSLVEENGMFHFLSPQIVQAPCGFDIVDLYEKGMIRMYHEIDEQNYVWRSRIQGNASWHYRSGLEKDRNVSLNYQ